MRRFDSLVEHFRNVWASVASWPPREAWLQCLQIFGLFVLCAASIGSASGFLYFRLAGLPLTALVLLPFSIAIRPAFVEEFLFRVVLLPRNTEDVPMRRLIAIAAIALAAFVVSHPVHGWLSRPADLNLFTSPVFLLIAALLGFACTITYWISKSIWPPFFLHWVSVLVWILFLGGAGKLAGNGLSP